MGLVGNDTGVDLPFYGIAADVGVDGDGESVQAGDEFGEEGQGRNAAVGDDEWPPHSLRLQVVSHEAARAGAEMDRRGEAEAMDHSRGRWRGATTGEAGAIANFTAAGTPTPCGGATIAD